MQGKVHVAIGVASLGMFCVAFPSGFEFAGAKVIPQIGLITAAFGSYLPDIDMQRTHMGQKHKVASNVINKVGGGHRGITHTLLFPALIALAMYAVSLRLTVYPYMASIAMSLLFGVEFGYVAHIIADLFNGKGCPILWPLSRTKISLMDLPSSGAVPWIFTIIVVVLEGAAIYFFRGGISL